MFDHSIWLMVPWIFQIMSQILYLLLRFCGNRCLQIHFSHPSKCGRIKRFLSCLYTKRYRSLKGIYTYEWSNVRCSKTELKKQHFWVSSRQSEGGEWALKSSPSQSFTKGSIAFFVPLQRYLWLAQTWMSKGRACFCPTPNPPPRSRPSNQPPVDEKWRDQQRRSLFYRLLQGG